MDWLGDGGMAAVDGLYGRAKSAATSRRTPKPLSRRAAALGSAPGAMSRAIAGAMKSSVTPAMASATIRISTAGWLLFGNTYGGR